MSSIDLVLGIIGGSVLLFLLALAVSVVRMRIRRRSFTGRFQATVAAADGGQRNLGEAVDDEIAARAQVVRSLAEDPEQLELPRVGWILAEVADGSWVVADEVHAL
ncbi:MAG: hypothetical protein ACKVHU_02440 [Acidimicrobiales bacterium]|jgi:hypothetical protein